MTWGPTFDKSGSHLIACVARRLLDAKAWVLSAVSQSTTLAPPHQASQAPILNDAFSKPHICDCLYCAFPRNHLGAKRDWERGKRCVFRGATKSLSDARHFPIDLFKNSPALPSADICSSQPIQEPKYFSPKIATNCCCCAHVAAHAQYVPMKRQNLSKTLKVAKKSISSHKLFIIIVTSTIHYATENNCKEISQDRNLVRMHHHHHVWKTAKLNDLSNCLFFILQAKMRSTM